MKNVSSKWLLVVPLALVVGAGCAKKAVVADAKPTSQKTAPAPEVAATPAPAPQSNNAELEAALRDTVLYFALDDSTLSGESQEKLRHLAEVLRKRSGAAVRIAGHADERGTVEYNLALGHRRAAAARKYLVDLGVASAVVDTVSFGSERPAVTGTGEDAWSKNRRAEFNTAER